METKEENEQTENNLETTIKIEMIHPHLIDDRKKQEAHIEALKTKGYDCIAIHGKVLVATIPCPANMDDKNYEIVQNLIHFLGYIPTPESIVHMLNKDLDFPARFLLREYKELATRVKFGSKTAR